MRKKLTAISVANYKPDPTKRLEIPDDGCRGLYLVVQPSGRKSWAVRYRHDGKPCKLTLPGFLPLATARSHATDALKKVAEGGDPAAQKQEAKRAKDAPRADLVDDAFHLFMDKHVRTKKGRPIRETTRRETGRLLGFKRDPNDPEAWIKSGGGALAEWTGKRLDAIKPADVRDLVESLVNRGPVMANRTLTALKTCFKWHVKRDRTTTMPFSPCEDIDPPAPEGEGRARVLKDTELAAVWRAADAEARVKGKYQFGRMVQMLILTGCRRDEVRDATWFEFDLPKREWLIPGERTKNGRELLIPLSDSAMAILQALPRITGKGFLFTTTGDTPISGLSKIKARVEKAMAKELKEELKYEPAPWTLHDLRRTFYTGLQSLGVADNIIERCVNHRSGTRTGVGATYGRYEFVNEKRAALDVWARHVAAIVKGGPKSNVINLKSTR